MKKLFLQIKPVTNDVVYVEKLLNVGRRYKEWFGIDIPVPRVFFIQSRKDYDEIMGRKTEDWVVGTAESGGFYILDPKVYTKESSHKDIAHFWKVIGHEYAHLFYEKKVGANVPKWLNEGLASYLAEQNYSLPTLDDAVDVGKYFDKSDNKIYSVGNFWVRYLIKTYGKEKFIRMLGLLSTSKVTKAKFSKVFDKVYGFSPNKTNLRTHYFKQSTNSTS